MGSSPEQFEEATSVRVHPGDRVGERYLVYEQTDENWGVCGWRARDEVLGRDVLLTTFHPDDPRAPALVAAARAAATVGDHRFVRVLDAHIASPTGFLVREWAGGRSLADLLGGGPLPEDVAVSLTREVAEALQSAHDAGLHHLCVDATSVVIDDEGAVRIRGLGTAAVLRGVQPSPQGAARDDTAGVGRVLYAALTARLPAAEVAGLPVARRSDDTVPAPRQVRAGVSPLLDAVAVRALGTGRTHRSLPYATPGEVARALAAVTSGEPSRPAEPVLAPARGAPAGLLGDIIPAAASSARPALDPEPGVAPPLVPPPLPDDHGGSGRRGGPPWLRAAAIVAGVAIGLGGLLLGVELLAANRVPELDPADSPIVEEETLPAPAPAVEGVSAREVVSARDYDPWGNGSENSERTSLAVDGDAGTAWSTQTYFDPLEQQKPGVGLLLDFGRPVPVQAVDLDLQGLTSDVEVRLAPPDAFGVPPTQDGFTLFGRAEGAGSTASVTGEPSSTRFVLVWFTRLPQTGGGWRGGVSEAVVRG
jgi:putative peptidoglycan lipid II flippase